MTHQYDSSKERRAVKEHHPVSVLWSEPNVEVDEGLVGWGGVSGTYPFGKAALIG